MTLISLASSSAVAADGSFLREFAETRRYLAGRPVNPLVTADGTSVLFLRATAKAPEQTLFELDVATGQVRELLTPEAVLNGAAETLTAAEKAELERKRVSARGFTSYQLSKDGSKTLLALSGRLYVVERASGKVTPLKTGSGAALDPRFSPDGASVAYVRDNDVRVVDLKKNVEKQVTKGGTELNPNGLAEFVAQEEMSRFSGFWFSPDSKSMAYAHVDNGPVERLRVSDPLHPEKEPDLFSYPRAGTPNAKVSLLVTPVGGGKAVAVRWNQSDFPYLATVRWSNGPLTILVQNREQTRQQLLAVDDKTGHSRLLLEEADEAWLNLNQEFPAWLKDGSGFFWGTEQNGGPEVQLRGKGGALEATWVKPEAGYGDLVGFDEAGRTLYFTGGPDPTQSTVWRVKEGGAPEKVKTDVEGPAVQTAKLSDDGALLVVTSTSVALMPRTTVLKVDGSKVGVLPSVAVEPSLPLNIEFRQVGDQKFNAAVIRPNGFKAGTRYPVVLEVYGGPGHQEVLQVKRENLVLQWLADQGFIVVKVDGRGTPRRGRDFERAIKSDFATLTVVDQLKGLKALAHDVPEMDLARVGVYGWSFGGYLAALLTLSRGDDIKSGVAGAPVVDWHDYDTHYTERYLGVPPAAEKAYEVSSLLTYVPRSRRPLLIIHGTADDNVYFMHTLKLSDAMFRAGKPHQVLPLSNFTHMVPEPQVTERLWERIAQHFKDTL